MSTKVKLLDIFNSNPQRYISAQELADSLSTSIDDVFETIETLKQEGFDIDSKSGSGYKLLGKKDVYSKDQIEDALNIPCHVHILEKIDSTNDYAKKLTDSSIPNVIIANEQTNGRGRLGRQFYSPTEKGLYMTIAFDPDFTLDKSMFITILSSLAVCHAIEQVTGINSKIKWVNDIYIYHKKVGGILTEAEYNFETQKIKHVIIGIGLNCFEQIFPDDIKDRATYLKTATKEFTRSQLAIAIVNDFFKLLKNFDKEKILLEYKSRSLVLGKKILLYGTAFGQLPENDGKGTLARAVDIDENGGLIVEYLEGHRFGEIDSITSGEVTLREVT